MRNTEERAAAVKRRVKEIERQERIRRNRIVGISSAAVCVVLITGLSFAMPEIMSELPGVGYAFSGTSASVFYWRSSFGYVFIGLLAFILGVTVTILCYRIRLRNQVDREEMEK